MSVEDFFITHFNGMGRHIEANATNKGFWRGQDTTNINTVGCKLALIHSEISEALEAARDSYPRSVKIPEIGNFEEELADAVIRCMDLATRMELDLGAAIVKKVEYNVKRPWMHGKKA